MASSVWNNEAQTFHGGQDWKFLSNFVEDFSVTTNGLGTPKQALKAANDALQTIHHYPPADFQPALSHLAKFLWPETWETNMQYLTLGNGASELIDLVIRSVRPGPWRPGKVQTQYMEYSRSAQANGRNTVAFDDKSAVLTCLVNPTNPTGDYMDVQTIMKYIEEYCNEGHTVIVDESMQLWVGKHWREDSLIHQREWIQRMSSERRIDVWVMTSWTKIWACPGIRLGSVVAPTIERCLQVKKTQVPWSVNSMALAFLSAVVLDTEYLEETWRTTTIWRKNLTDQITKFFPEWIAYGKPFLSWVWVDIGNADIARKAVKLTKEAGVPIRSGEFGYNLPTYVRIQVRNPETTQILLQALNSLRN